MGEATLGEVSCWRAGDHFLDSSSQPEGGEKNESPLVCL